MKTVNLEEILKLYAFDSDSIDGISFNDAICAMRTACNQTIELFIEEADGWVLGTHIDGTPIINRSKLRTFKSKII